MKALTIGKKISFGFGWVLIMLAFMNVMSFTGITVMSRNIEDAISKNELIETLTSKEIEQLNWSNEVVALLTDDSITALAIPLNVHECEFGKWLDGNYRRETESIIPELKDIFSKIDISHLDLHSSVVEINDHYIDAQENPEGIGTANEIFISQVKPSLKTIQSLMLDARHQVATIVEGTNEKMLSKARSTIYSGGVMSLLTMVVGISLAYFVRRNIVTGLRKIIKNLDKSSNRVGTASSQVSEASHTLAEGANEQAVGLEKTSSSLEEMSSMTQQNTENAQKAATSANNAKEFADTGGQAVSNMNKAMEEVEKSSNESAKIVKVIDDIAFQTNLLALNAAVEAARAGEAGKGFAVVAEEVRNLAIRSAKAAQDTSGMIEESIKNAQNGVIITKEVSKILTDIVNTITDTSQLVGQIAVASSEQSEGIEQINDAMVQMDSSTQQNAASAQESASASEELNSQAKNMRKLVSALVAMVETKNIQEATMSNTNDLYHKIATDNKENVAISASEAEKEIPLETHDQFAEFNK